MTLVESFRSIYQDTINRTTVLNRFVQHTVNMGKSGQHTLGRG